MVGRVAPLVLVADSTALGVWTYLARVLLEEYTWQCSCSSVFCHGGKGSPSGALCRRSSSTVHRSIYYQTLLSVLCYHLDSLVCLFVVFMFHPVTQGNENQSINSIVGVVSCRRKTKVRKSVQRAKFSCSKLCEVAD